MLVHARRRRFEWRQSRWRSWRDSGGQDRTWRWSGEQVRSENTVRRTVEGRAKSGNGSRHATAPYARPRLACEAAHEEITGGRFETRFARFRSASAALASSLRALQGAADQSDATGGQPEGGCEGRGRSRLCCRTAADRWCRLAGPPPRVPREARAAAPYSVLSPVEAAASRTLPVFHTESERLSTTPKGSSVSPRPPPLSPCRPDPASAPPPGGSLEPRSPPHALHSSGRAART